MRLLRRRQHEARRVSDDASATRQYSTQHMEELSARRPT